MGKILKNALSRNELLTISSIIQVGEATFNDLMADQHMFGHRYFTGERGRIRTKLVQMQCQLESEDSKFPFEFSERTFKYKQCVPELHTKNMILHIARSASPDMLPYESKYKVELSNNNAPLCRQLMLELNNIPPVIKLAPFYGLIVFGGREKCFTTIQFPAPGYSGIADYIDIPQIVIEAKSEDAKTFERKKAGLKQEFLAHEIKGFVS